MEALAAGPPRALGALLLRCGLVARPVAASAAAAPALQATLHTFSSSDAAASTCASSGAQLDRAVCPDPSSSGLARLRRQPGGGGDGVDLRDGELERRMQQAACGPSGRPESPAAAAWQEWRGVQAAFQLPHGLLYMPLGPRPAPLGASGGHGGWLAPGAPADWFAPGASADEGLQCITTKTWRRLKMKKHKVRKRRKLTRHKNK